MINNLNWNEVEARAKEMSDSNLLGAYNDCVDCIRKGVANEGYYYDEASVYWRALKKRGLTMNYGEIK